MRPISHPIAKLRCNRFRPHRPPLRRHRRRPSRRGRWHRPKNRRSQSQPNRSAPACRRPRPHQPHQTPLRRRQRISRKPLSARRADPTSCPIVQPGGAEALQCLKRNEAQLSAACRGAVAAIGGGAPAAAVSPSGAPAAAVAPIGPIPMLRPRESLAIVQICGPEVRSLCAGVPFGGGRVISCLAANASSLSPGCYGALSAAAGR